MSIPGSVVAAQVQSLIERLERYREQRSAAEQRNAEERAQAIVRQARREARARMRESVAYERARLADALQRRRAAHEAECRRREHASLREFVSQACELLPALLARRWSNAAARRAWCQAALEAAGSRLRGSEWTIEIAAGLKETERHALLAQAAALRPGRHAIAEVADLVAGLRVIAEGAMLDASAAGLLDDRVAIGARVLRECLHPQGDVAKAVAS